MAAMFLALLALLTLRSFYPFCGVDHCMWSSSWNAVLFWQCTALNWHQFPSILICKHSLTRVPTLPSPLGLFLCQLAWTASFRSFPCCLLGWWFKRRVLISFSSSSFGASMNINLAVVLGDMMLFLLSWLASLTFFDFTVCFQTDRNAKLNIVFI